MENAPIKVLDLSNNNIGDQGAEYLAELLEKKHTLTDLHLNSNRIGDKGVQMLSSVLSRRATKLQRLYLHNNSSISDKSVDYLVDMLKRNQSLNTLWLINCTLTNMGRQKLREAVASKRNFYLNVESFDS